MVGRIKKSALQPGDRLEKVGSMGSVWIVDHIVETSTQLPHAVIAYEKDPEETRLLAVSVLLDDSRYRLVLPH